MQATVTKAVLPLWSFHSLPYLPFRITRQVINILTDCTTGTAAAAAVLNRASAVIRPTAQADPAMVQNIVDMGFSRARVEETLRRVCTSPCLVDIRTTFWTHISGVLGIARRYGVLVVPCWLAVILVKTCYSGLACLPLCRL